MENIYVDIIFTYLLEIFAKVKLKCCMMYDSTHVHFSIPYTNKYFVYSEFDS